MPRPLTLLSEPYSASGNLAADGYRKLLGAPSINLIQTVIREAVQNSCDAALGDGSAEVHFRLRTLEQSQCDALWTNVLTDLPKEEDAASRLVEYRQSEQLRVLEICDFGTKGLAGPTRADVAPKEGEPTDFVDFLRNVGSARDTHQGGGTYGYGKASLYLASRCSTIVIDSQTANGGSPVRRLIAAQLGSAFQASDAEGAPKRYTGRHWWGIEDDNEAVVDPAEGDDAERLAEALGLLERDHVRSGTSIMILDPQLGDGDDEAAIRGIHEALLWFFWPRLLESTPEDRKMQFRVFLEDEERPLPRPEDFAPLDLFARAMNGIRNGSDTCEDIQSQRPAKHLGKLNIVRGMRGERKNGAGADESLFPHRCAAIAVMRPVELVVRYYVGDHLPDDRLEWAGVFVASDDKEVEAAFAKAEPPAHDDWQSESLEDSRARRFVNVAVRDIKRAAKEYAYPTRSIVAGGSSGPSLAAVAGLMGRALNGGNGEGAGPKSSGIGSGSTARKKFKVSPPRFVRLQQGIDGPVAIFEANVASDGQRRNRLYIQSAFAMDGGTTTADDVASAPEIVSVVHEDELIGSGGNVDIGLRTGRVEIGVAMLSDYAVTLNASLDEVSA